MLKVINCTISVIVTDFIPQKAEYKITIPLLSSNAYIHQ